MWRVLERGERCRVCGSDGGHCERGDGTLEGWLWCSVGEERDAPGLQQYGDHSWSGIYGPAEATPPREASPSVDDLGRRQMAIASRRVYDGGRARGVVRTALEEDERSAEHFAALGIDAARIPGGGLPGSVRYSEALDRWARDGEGWKQLEPGPAIVGALVDAQQQGLIIGVWSWHLEGPQDERWWAGVDSGATLRIGKGAPHGVLVVAHGIPDALAIAAATGWTTWGAVSMRSALRVPLPSARNIRRVLFALRWDGSLYAVEDPLLLHDRLRQLAEAHPHYPLQLRLPPLLDNQTYEPWTMVAARGASAVGDALREGPDFEGSERSKGTNKIDLADLEETEDGGLAMVKELCLEQEVEIHQVLSSNSLRRARRMLRELFAPDEPGPWRGYALRRSDETWWRYTGTKYVPIRGEKAEAMGVTARHWLNRAPGWWTVKGGRETRLARLNPSEKQVHELLENLKVDVYIDAAQMPCWVEQEFDEHGAVLDPERDPLRRAVDDEDLGKLPHPWELSAFQNGLLDLREWCEGRMVLRPHTERYFAATSLPYDFPLERLQELAGEGGRVDDADLDELISEMCPTWLEFLKSVNVREDPDWENLLSMFMGYCLTPWTKYEVILVMAGAKGGGKGTIMAWLQQLIGKHNHASARLSLLTKQFTLSSYIGKLVIELPDADVGRMVDGGEVAETLKMISGQDPVYADRKHKDPLASVRLPAKIVMSCNRMPNIPDTGGALAERFRVLSFVESFREDGKVNRKFKDPQVIKREAAGLMLWALRGLRQLEELGRFPQPEHGAQLLGEYRDYSDPTGRFVAECLDRDDKSWMETRELFALWKVSCEERGREPGSVELFCKQLRAACPWIDRCQDVVEVDVPQDERSIGDLPTRKVKRWGYRGLMRRQEHAEPDEGGIPT